VSFKANTDGIKILSAALKQCIPDSAAQLRKTIRDDVGPLIGHAAERNADWSKKIPRTIRWTASGTTVRVRAGYKSVPIAKWFEQGHSASSKTLGKWDHPRGIPGIGFDARLPRDKWPWGPQRVPHRPYLKPALEETRKEAGQRILLALVDTLQNTIEEAGA
jgi:hypothetical protein